MALETGASTGSLPTSFADKLIADGAATEGPPEKFKLADGSIPTARTIIIADVMIGGHMVHQVRHCADPLLGFNALSAVGMFKIDPAHGSRSANSGSHIFLSAFVPACGHAVACIRRG
jgi:hypothetical protein